MELDFSISTILVTFGMWAFIVYLVWGIKVGFSGMFEKVVLTTLSLPITYGIVLWQKNR